MRCLVVGGTGFLGGAITDRLVAAGHTVDVLSRGETKRETPNGVNLIHANRYEDLAPLKNQQYDWVFDTCAFAPDAVLDLLDALGDKIERYVFISSLSAFGRFETPGLTETQPVLEATTEELEAVAAVPTHQKSSAPAYGSAYGALKRSCEIAAQKRLGQRATSLRVGLLVGAGDYTDRLGYWVRRIDQAIEAQKLVAAPAPKTRLVQLIDVFDIADFALQCAANQTGGVFNVTSAPMQFDEVLDTIIDETGSSAEIKWATDDQILTAEIAPWTDVPMMTPPKPEFQHFFEIDTSKAERAGLTCRPLRETLVPLIKWDRTRRDIKLKCGLTPEMEDRLLST